MKLSVLEQEIQKGIQVIDNIINDFNYNFHHENISIKEKSGHYLFEKWLADWQDIDFSYDENTKKGTFTCNIYRSVYTERAWQCEIKIPKDIQSLAFVGPIYIGKAYEFNSSYNQHKDQYKGKYNLDQVVIKDITPKLDKAEFSNEIGKLLSAGKYDEAGQLFIDMKKQCSQDYNQIKKIMQNSVFEVHDSHQWKNNCCRGKSRNLDEEQQIIAAIMANHPSISKKELTKQSNRCIME